MSVNQWSQKTETDSHQAPLTIYLCYTQIHMLYYWYWALFIDKYNKLYYQHTHTQTHIYIYIYIYMCVCVCVCVWKCVCHLHYEIENFLPLKSGNIKHIGNLKSCTVSLTVETKMKHKIYTFKYQVSFRTMRNFLQKIIYCRSVCLFGFHGI